MVILPVFVYFLAYSYFLLFFSAPFNDYGFVNAALESRSQLSEDSLNQILSYRYPQHKDAPKSYELRRGVLVHPPPCWGQRVRNVRSLRILAIGGSNCAGIGCEHRAQGFVGHLADYARNFSKSSYLINECIGGYSARGFLGEHFEFEKRVQLIRWPNVILLENSLNSGDNFQSTALLIEQLVLLLKSRWADKGLPTPYFVFIELFSTDHDEENEGNETPIKRKAKLSGYPGKTRFFNRAAIGGTYVTALARFHEYPLLTSVDSMWPSFARHFIRHNTSVAWPLGSRGHLSCAGHLMFAHEIVIPFFHKTLVGKITDDRCYEDLEKDDTKFRNGLTIFPHASDNIEIIDRWWSPWTARNPTLHTIVDDNHTSIESWSYIPVLLDDVGRKCLGSTKRDSVVSFMVTAPTVCKPTCGVELYYMYSWNTSRIGGAECSLISYSTMNHTSPVLVDKVVTDGHTYDGKAELHTVPKRLVVSHQGMQAGQAYRVSCRSMNDKIACIVNLAVFRSGNKEKQ